MCLIIALHTKGQTHLTTYLPLERAVKETLFQARMKFNDSLLESYAFSEIFPRESLEGQTGEGAAQFRADRVAENYDKERHRGGNFGGNNVISRQQCYLYQ